MKVLALVSLFLYFPSICLGLSIFDTQNKKFISEQELANQLPTRGQIVLGEYHYQPAIQKAQGEIIKKVVKTKALEDNFSVAWEFLDYPAQTHIEQIFTNYKNDLIDERELVELLFSQSRNPHQNDPYLAFLKATKEANGEVLGSNAPRKWKSVITRGGLTSLDPKYIPPQMELGSAHYRERFAQAMGNHVPADKLQNYFEAQCYTDSVMAWSMMEHGNFELKFLIVGSFHSDYNDGVVAQLKRYSELPTAHIKIVETKGMSPSEVFELTKPDPKYGPLADYLYLID